jgi:riboflavin kinase / FMN adenylyltransferase
MMRITQQLEDLRLERGSIVLAVGSFDGVHKGHQRVIRRAAEKARAVGGEAWAMTLDPHPMKVLKPETAPPLITSTPHKLRLMEPLGIDGCVVMSFTPELAGEEPRAFIARLKNGVPALGELVVGENWTFGHGGRGNTSLLKKLAPSHHLAVTIVEPVLWNGKVISSTRIREAVARGDLKDAEEMMGRPFSILGTVVPGRRVGGQMGFPTANLDPHNEVRPPSGVYGVRVDVGGRVYDGAGFVAETGEAKTTPSGFVVEVYVIGFDGDLYGRDIEVFFIERVREVRHFRGREALRQQIARDVEQVRQMLAARTS